MYEIARFKLPDGTVMHVLSLVGKKSFMQELVENPRTRQRAALITKAVRQVRCNGIEWAFASETFKWISKGISVCELRIKGKVIRVMTYLGDDSFAPVYLFDFDGHQGKRASVPPFVIARAKRLAQEAAMCIRRERGEGNE